MLYLGVNVALNLKNPEVERLAAEVARLTGESKTEAIRRSLEERRRRLKGPPGSRRDRVLGHLRRKCATEAFARYGRGRHKAAPNFGDCLAYATAAAARDTLLFVGDDFRLTDITPAT